VRGVGRVLIADDTVDTRELYALFLRHTGYEVEVVADGEAAVERVPVFRPDVVVMDLSMPRLDGIAATQRLRGDDRTRQIPVILLTAYPDRAISQGALEHGVDVFLTKPCLPEELEERIRQLLPHGRPLQVVAPAGDPEAAERIAALLHEHAPFAYCVGCIARELRLDEANVRNAVQRLLVGREYTVRRLPCSNCRREATVVRLAAP
jgi:CheY-like chemotaxis protein